MSVAVFACATRRNDVIATRNRAREDRSGRVADHALAQGAERRVQQFLEQSELAARIDLRRRRLR